MTDSQCGYRLYGRALLARTPSTPGRYEVETEQLISLPTPEGVVTRALVRPDGNVWYQHGAGDRQPLIFDERGAEVVSSEGPRAPEGRPYTSWHFDNPHGQRVRVGTWTVDDPEAIERLFSWGVDAVATNVPEIAVPIRDRFRSHSG